MVRKSASTSRAYSFGVSFSISFDASCGLPMRKSLAESSTRSFPAAPALNSFAIASRSLSAWAAVQGSSVPSGTGVSSNTDAQEFEHAYGRFAVAGRSSADTMGTCRRAKRCGVESPRRGNANRRSVRMASQPDPEGVAIPERSELGYRRRTLVANEAERVFEQFPFACRIGLARGPTRREDAQQSVSRASQSYCFIRGDGAVSSIRGSARLHEAGLRNESPDAA